jgi:hypothetical protein
VVGLYIDKATSRQSLLIIRISETVFFLLPDHILWPIYSQSDQLTMLSITELLVPSPSITLSYSVPPTRSSLSSKSSIASYCMDTSLRAPPSPSLPFDCLSSELLALVFEQVCHNTYNKKISFYRHRILRHGLASGLRLSYPHVCASSFKEVRRHC